MPNESAAPIVRIDSSAPKFLRPNTFDIAGPSCATSAIANNLRSLPRAIGSRLPRLLSLAPAARFDCGRGFTDLKSFSAHPVACEFFHNIRIHGLGIGYIQFALRNRAIALLGEAAPVQRRRQPRIDLERRIKIRDCVLYLPALQVE